MSNAPKPLSSISTPYKIYRVPFYPDSSELSLLPQTHHIHNLNQVGLVPPISLSNEDSLRNNNLTTSAWCAFFGQRQYSNQLEKKLFLCNPDKPISLLSITTHNSQETRLSLFPTAENLATKVKILGVNPEFAQNRLEEDGFESPQGYEEEIGKIKNILIQLLSSNPNTQKAFVYEIAKILSGEESSLNDLQKLHPETLKMLLLHELVKMNRFATFIENNKYLGNDTNFQDFEDYIQINKIEEGFVHNGWTPGVTISLPKAGMTLKLYGPEPDYINNKETNLPDLVLDREGNGVVRTGKRILQDQIQLGLFKLIYSVGVMSLDFSKRGLTSEILYRTNLNTGVITEPYIPIETQRRANQLTKKEIDSYNIAGQIREIIEECRQQGIQLSHRNLDIFSVIGNNRVILADIPKLMPIESGSLTV